MLLQNATVTLLQNATEVYYKMRQVFHYKMRQLLQNATMLLQNATFVTNCDSTSFYNRYILLAGKYRNNCENEGMAENVLTAKAHSTTGFLLQNSLGNSPFGIWNVKMSSWCRESQNWCQWCNARNTYKIGRITSPCSRFTIWDWGER